MNEQEITAKIKAIYEGKGGVVHSARTALRETYEAGYQAGVDYAASHITRALHEIQDAQVSLPDGPPGRVGEIQPTGQD